MVKRYVLRHIRRASARSLLCFLLAAALLGAFGQYTLVVRRSEDTVEEMYAGAVVDASLVATDGTAGSGLPLYALHDLLDTGFAESFCATANSIVYWTAPEGTYSEEDDMYNDGFILYAANVPEQLGVTDIEYAAGYGPEVFDSTGQAVCFVSRELSELRGIMPGDMVTLSGIPTEFREQSGGQDSLMQFEVAGLYEAEKFAHEEDVLVPLWTLELLRGDFYGSGAQTQRLSLCTFRVKNGLLHDDKAYRDRPLAVLSESDDPSVNSFTLRFTDDELRNVIRPLESNTGTLRMLIPIIAALVVLIGGAVPALVVVQSSKDAALMRVLGMSKPKVRTVLTLEQILLALPGLLAGAGVLLLVHGGEMGAGVSGLSPIKYTACLGAVYFALAAVASLAGSIVVTARKPLELLQTKE